MHDIIMTSPKMDRVCLERDTSSKSHFLHELKNSAKTKGHRVTKMSPQTLILP